MIALLLAVALAPQPGCAVFDCPQAELCTYDAACDRERIGATPATTALAGTWNCGLTHRDGQSSIIDLESCTYIEETTTTTLPYKDEVIWHQPTQ